MSGYYYLTIDETRLPVWVPDGSPVDSHGTPMVLIRMASAIADATGRPVDVSDSEGLIVSVFPSG